jgi:flagellar hook-length control protein FliK
MADAVQARDTRPAKAEPQGDAQADIKADAASDAFADAASDSGSVAHSGKLAQGDIAADGAGAAHGNTATARDAQAATAQGAARATLAAAARGRAAKPTPVTEQSVIHSNPAAADPAAVSGSGRSTAKSASAKSASAKSASATSVSARSASASSSSAGSASAASGAGDAAATAMNDPLALAMLLAVAGMPTRGGATAAAAQQNQPVPAANALSPGQSTLPGQSSQPAQSTQPGQSAQPAQTVQPARDAAAAATDITDSTISAAAPDASSSLPQANSDAPSRNDQPAIMTGAVGLPDLARALNTGVAPAPSVDATVGVPVGSGSWPHAVAAQVHWFVSNGVQSATLRLSPEHLGPVEVHIDVQSSQVNVNFSAAHAETRAALEQTVPRLRELFASGGLTLGQANVQADPRPGSQSTPVPVRTAFSQAATLEPVAATAAGSLGLVDEYA